MFRRSWNHIQADCITISSSHLLRKTILHC